MTESSPEAIVREYYDLVDADRHEDLVALFAEDVRYERPGHDPIVGREDLLAFYEQDRPLEDGSHSIQSLIVDNETVAVRGTFSGRQHGQTVEFGFADFHEFDDGTIRRRYSFTDRDEV